ncbi:transcriptional repressor AgaR [Aureimonas pseudogalii]|uniref:transcriptional repressor AgaR n=1 Tax=Aureimonas pseudogalii TaxID=1744844 RepID=UPI001AEDE558|nr:transcriptional repressor AgaR [Aureimonas pseudogalii]
MKSSLERRDAVVAVLARQGQTRVEDLADRFGVSTVTIRSDLNVLERSGHVVRRHGQALLSNLAAAELAFNERRKLNMEAKARIGVEAARRVKDGDTILLDAGTTTHQIALNLKDRRELVVMTNGLDIAMELSHCPGIDIILLGGHLRKSALSLSGSQAERSLREYRFDTLFLGVDGFDSQIGITTFNEREASLNRIMCEVARQIVAVTDSSKFERGGHHLVCELRRLDVLVTDAGLPPALRSTLAAQSHPHLVVV